MTKTGTEQPRTAAGRQMLSWFDHTRNRTGWAGIPTAHAVLAVEAEASAVEVTGDGTGQALPEAASLSREALAAALDATKACTDQCDHEFVEWHAVDAAALADAVLAALEAGE